MASLVDAVQGMTRGALTDQAPAYEPTRNLPRDPLDTSPFGPLAPLFINAINPPRVDTGRPEPRVWEYPQGFNLPGGGDRLIPWETLRAASTNVDIIRRCIEIRKDDVRDLKTVWRISDKAVKAAQEADPGRPRDEIEADLRKRFAADIERLTAFWERPWITNGVRFGQWVAAVMEDHIALDAVAIYPITTFGGDVIGFRVVDGSTIKLLINDLGERPQPPFPAFQQVVNGFPRGEFIADVVLSEDGAEITDSTMFSASQITYWRENFRTYTPYGYSQVEQALVSAALYLKRQGWMHSEYDEGSTPLTWLVPQSDKFTANQLDPVKRREYEQAINDDLEGQTGKRHRIKISYPGFEPTQMDSVDERYKPEYDLFLLKLVSSHLGVTLDRLGFTEAKGLGATGQHERQAEVQDDSGVNPDAAMLQDLIMELSRNYLECPAELCFEFTKDKAEDEKAKDEINAARRSRGAITLNEDRKSLGLTPLSIEEADMPSMATATGMVYIEGGAQKQALMDEAAVKLAQNPPAPGMSGASGGRPGGTGGGTGAGGSAPKPSGPKSTGPSKPANPPRNKAAGPEIVAYHRWLRKQAGRIPARPFRFEAAQPDDLAIAGAQLDGRFQAFDGYEWRQDITKDWRSWNAQHPLHPRGPHGRFVKVGNLVDELRRTQGELSEHHENAFDEAVRRAHAGRHIRRGESQLADDLESRGFLEELGGAGNDKGRLSVSEAGRRHLQARWDEPDSELAVADPLPEEHTPAGVPESIADPVIQSAPTLPDLRAVGERQRARRDIITEESLEAREAGALDENFVPPPFREPTSEEIDVRVEADRRAAARPLTGDLVDPEDEDPRELSEILRGIPKNPPPGERGDIVDAETVEDARGQGPAANDIDAYFAARETALVSAFSAHDEHFGITSPAGYHEDSARTIAARERSATTRVSRSPGGHHVLIEDASVTPETVTIAEVTMDDLDEFAPLGRPIAVRLGVDTQGAGSHGGRGLANDTPITISTGHSNDVVGLGGASFMPSYKTTPDVRYTIAHEYGHHLALERPPSDEFWRANKDGLSAYGQSDPKEGYAEAFAEWYLTDGRTDNPSVRAFAERYDWRKPQEARTVEQALFGGATGSLGRRTPAEPSVEDARGQGVEDRLRQAEIMYGSDRSQWPAHAKRDAARMERLAARKPKAIEAAPQPAPDLPTSGGQVDTSPSTVESVKKLPALRTDMRPRIETYRGRKIKVRKDPREWGRLELTVNGESVGSAFGTRPGDLDKELEQLKLNIDAADLRRHDDPTAYPEYMYRGAPKPTEAETAQAAAYWARERADRADLSAFTPDVIEGEIEGDLPIRETTIPIDRTGRARLSDAGQQRAADTVRTVVDEARPTGLLNDDFSVNPEKVHAALLDASSREEAAALIDRLGLKVPELRQLARDMNIPVHSGAKKSDIRDTIVSLTAGRRLDSLAINPGNRPAGTVSASKAPVESGAARQLRIQVASYQTLLARAEELDTQINFADSDRERRILEGQRESLDQQMAALDRQIEAARKRVSREARKT